MTLLFHRISVATWWSGVETAVLLGVQFLTTLILARLLDPSAFGLLAMVLAVTAFGTLLADAGFGAALIQRPTVSHTDETTAFFFNVVAATAMSLSLWLGASTIAAVYREPTLTPLIKAMSFIFPLGAAGTVSEALLTRELKFKARATAQVISSVLSGCLGIGLALRGFGVWSLVGQALAGVGLRSVSLWIAAGWLPRGRPSLLSMRSLFRFGGYLLASGFLNVISTRIQFFALGLFFSASNVGYYLLAQRGADAPKNLINGVLGRVGLPAFSAIAQDKAALSATLRRALRLSMFLFLPLMLGIAIIAEPLVVLLYGKQWISVSPILSLLAISGALWPIHVLNLAALNAQGRSDRFFRLEIFKSVCTVLAVLLAARWGPMAVAIAMVATSLISAIANCWYTRKMLNYGIMAQISDQIPTYLLTTASLLPAWAIVHGDTPSATRTSAAIAIAVSIYFTIAVVTRYGPWLELYRVLGHLVDRPQINSKSVR